MLIIVALLCRSRSFPATLSDPQARAFVEGSASPLNFRVRRSEAITALLASGCGKTRFSRTHVKAHADRCNDAESETGFLVGIVQP